MLLLLILVLRLLLRRDPKFAVEPPPYANMPTLSPSSNAGRRQGWQFHANSDLAPPYHAEEGATHIRKVLTGMEGGKLLNWQIEGLRLSQYDQYGRISRSEVIARPRTLRRLNRIAGKAREADVEVEKLQRRLDGVVKPLARRLRSNINRRSSTLPIAMDLRFEGGHGEVRIFFELYQLDHGRWQRVDAWEPEMMVRGTAIHENFTYTLRGLQPGEEFKDFTPRLADDMVQLLLAMLGHEQKPVAEDTAH
jgi:hypothetical protein